MTKILRSQELSLVRAGWSGRREAVPKFLAVTRNRLEPFPGLRRLIVNPADMARIYSPDRRSRPPDPLRRSTRPARISPSGRVSFWATPIAAPAEIPMPKRIAPAFPLALARNELSFSRDSGVQSWPTHCLPVVASACHRRRDHPVASSERPRIPHVGTAACPCTRGGRAEVARSRRAQMRAFPRVASERALAALLLR